MPVRLLPILTALTCGLWALIILSLSFTSSFPGIVHYVSSILMTMTLHLVVKSECHKSAQLPFPVPTAPSMFLLQ